MANGKTNGYARLQWQCRRGMLELDLFLQGFMDKAYDKLSPEQQQVFSDLLETPDQMLLEYLMGRLTPFDKDVANVVQQIRNTASADT